MAHVDNKALICVSMTMGRREVFQEMLTMVRHEGEVRIKVMKLDAAAQLPRYAHTGAFGDLAADLFAVAGVTLDAGATVAVATGVAMEFPS